MLPWLVAGSARPTVFGSVQAWSRPTATAAASRAFTSRAGPAGSRWPAAKLRPTSPGLRLPWRTQHRGYIDPRDPRLVNAKPLWIVQTPGRILRAPGTRSIALVAAIAACVFYFSHLETVPVSGRTRFNCYSQKTMSEIGEIQRDRVLQDIRAQGAKILPSWDLRTQRVKRVMQRLIPFSGMPDENWEIFVIDDPNTQNAFVLPGGKVFVFSGILRTTRNDDGLAAVLGHEIAHNLANHSAERISSNIGTNILMWSMIILTAPLGGLSLLMPIFGWKVLDIAYDMPQGRRQESEADFIGLIMMAEACYDPREAVNFWRRMEQMQQLQPPEWLSTHPSNESRIEKIQQWLPQALEKAAQSDCRTTAPFADRFTQAMQRGFIL